MPTSPSVREATGRGCHDAVVRTFGGRPFVLDGELLALTFAGGRGLWSVEEGGLLRRWDADSGEQREWHVLTDLATLWAFGDDGRLLAAAADELTLWETASGRLRARAPQHSWVTALAFDRTGQLLATGHDDGTVHLWRLPGLAALGGSQPHHRPVSALAFRPDGRVLATAGEGKVIHLVDVENGRPVRGLAGHTDRIPALAWHPDGRRLFSAGWDTTVRAWDADSGEPLILMNNHASQVTALALSPDGTVLAAADSASSIHLWDASQYRTLRVIAAGQGEVRCLAVSPDGARVAVGGEDRIINVWDVAQGRRVAGPAEPVHVPPRAAVSTEGSLLAATGVQASLCAWDTKKARVVWQKQEAGEFRALALSPDGRLVATGGSGRGVQLWDGASGELLRTLDGPQQPATCVEFSPDGRALVACGDGGTDVWLWEVDSGQPRLMIPAAAEGRALTALGWHPHRPGLAVAGVAGPEGADAEGTIVLWDLDARQPSGALAGPANLLTFDRSGRWLAAAHPGHAVRLWEPERGGLVAELVGHEAAVRGLAFLPDRPWLASGSEDGTVRLWEVPGGRLLGHVRLDTRVQSLCASPDGRSLFTANGRGSLYQLDVHRLLTRADAHGP